MSFFISSAHAQAAAPSSGLGGDFSGLLLIAGMFILMYFMIIRPQNKREKERRALLEAVKVNDKIVFGGGILGHVSSVKDKTLIVKIADNVKVEITRSAVGAVLGKDETPDDL